MDDERFDGLVRAFSVNASRRGALGIFGGLAALGVHEAVARRRKRGNPRRAGHPPYQGREQQSDDLPSHRLEEASLPGDNRRGQCRSSP
jgi:hypothetical protein